MNKIKSLILALLLTVAVGVLPALGQTNLNSTTLDEAVDNSETRIDIVSATNVSVGDIAFVDFEAMVVVTVDSTNNIIGVRRGTSGTVAEDHANGTKIWIDKPDRFISKDLSGSCTAASEYPAFKPLINLSNGNRYRCQSSQWDRIVSIGRIEGAFRNAIRLNSRDFTNTSGGITAVQVKPSQTVTSTGNLVGMEISPRLQDGVTSLSITGLHVDVDLKGTTAVTTSENVRGIEVELVTSNSGTRTISGYVTGIRFRSVFSATAITGNFTAMRFEFPEAQTNSQTYDAWLEFTGTIPLVWNDTPATEPTTGDGYLRVIVNGSTRWIQLFSGAPAD